MIKSWRHKGLEEFFVSDSKAGIRPDHASKLKRQLSRLDEARSPQDMNVPGWKLHELEGALAGHYAVKVNGKWRMTFKFDGTDVILVDYQDYD
jgi:toxin HigB-1